jgi:hypothetical protein
MLRRLLIIFALTFLPSTAALALTGAPIITATTNVNGALLDQVSKSTAPAAAIRAQGILAYNLTFHDDKYTYTVPLCADSQLLEVNGRGIDPINFIPNDTIAVALRPNVATDAKSCAARVVRQKISSGSSQGGCLQGFQVLHEIEGAPSHLVTGTEYTYVLSIYNRPTLECDGKAYGASPITTTVALAKPFIVYLDRVTPSGIKELMRWSITTNNAGTARIVYTFAASSDTYKFHIMPGGTNVAGDLIDWSANVADSHPSPSPDASAPTDSSNFTLTTAPIVAVLIIVLVVAAGAEYWHWVRKKRETESPEQEYQRTQRL